jgi:hypothetical protein
VSTNVGENVSAFLSLLHGQYNKQQLEKLFVIVLLFRCVYQEGVSHADTPWDWLK